MWLWLFLGLHDLFGVNHVHFITITTTRLDKDNAMGLLIRGIDAALDNARRRQRELPRGMDRELVRERNRVGRFVRHDLLSEEE